MERVLNGKPCKDSPTMSALIISWRCAVGMYNVSLFGSIIS
ncbi:hypothetical protein [Methanobrevibacter sp.]